MNEVAESPTVWMTVRVSTLHRRNGNFQLRLEFSQETEDMGWPQAFRKQLAALGAQSINPGSHSRTLVFDLYQEADIRPAFTVVAEYLRKRLSFSGLVRFKNGKRVYAL